MSHYDRGMIQVDLDAIRNNMIHMKNNIDVKTKMIGVIKTDGYGHGATAIAKELSNLDFMWGFAVATVEEAMMLRRDGIQMPLLILGYTFPYSYEEMIRNEIRPAVFTIEMARDLSAQAVRLGMTARIHVKVDTGMSRIGIVPDETGFSFIKELLTLPNLAVEGIFTHFARADETDKTAAMKQFERFTSFIQKVEEELNVKIPYHHCSNSASIVELKNANLDLVRAGITLYGLWPSEEVDQKIVALTPALSFVSHVVYVKTLPAGTPVSYGGTYVTSGETRVATIPIGYGDGYPRALSNVGEVLIRGKRAPIIGRVCMDQFMVDVTAIEDVCTGDVVTLIGHDGSECITMEELGAKSGRFNYELACDLGKRLPRVYVKDGRRIAEKDYFTDVPTRYL